MSLRLRALCLWPFQFSLSLFRGAAKAALYCAHRTSTFLSCAFCEQKGHLAAPCAAGGSFQHSAARIIHDSSSRNRAVAWRDGHAEPRSPEAYLNSTSREWAASLPTEGVSQQRIRDCSRSAHE